MEIPFGRRVFFGTMLVVLAVLAAVGEGQLASAAPKQVEGYGSAEAFKRACGRQGGTLAYGLGGEIACRLGNGSIVCDHRGNNCWFYPSASRDVEAHPDGDIVVGTGGVPGKNPGHDFSSIELDGGLSGSSSGDVSGDSGDNVAAP